uniref:Uncharacterized protein n=1 Tax=Lactuca sativa TaxID=4236 RepID=A0A9R1WC15_LACSA|nr:hypothetical protein LSAT_V11C200071060 [Lactuca sativa]
MEKYKERNMDLHMVFIDLEKRNLEDKGVPRAYFKAIHDMYYHSTTSVRTLVEVPWYMFFYDDIVLVVKLRAKLNARLDTWRVTLEDKGLHIITSKQRVSLV